MLPRKCKRTRPRHQHCQTLHRRQLHYDVMHIILMRLTSTTLQTQRIPFTTTGRNTQMDGSGTTSRRELRCSRRLAPETVQIQQLSRECGLLMFNGRIQSTKRSPTPMTGATVPTPTIWCTAHQDHAPGPATRTSPTHRTHKMAVKRKVLTAYSHMASVT